MIKKKPLVGQTLAQRFSSVIAPNIKYLIEQLSDLEYQIARMTVDGLIPTEISKRLLEETEQVVSVHMVRGYYRQKIYEKLGIPPSILMLCLALDGPVPTGCVFRGLTDRKNDIARLLFVGMNNKEMAKALNLEEKTIKRHKEEMREVLRKGGITEDLSNPAKLLKAMRSVMIHDKAHTSLLNGLYDAQEKAGDKIVPPKMG